MSTPLLLQCLGPYINELSTATFLLPTRTSPQQPQTSTADHQLYYFNKQEHSKRKKPFNLQLSTLATSKMCTVQYQQYRDCNCLRPGSRIENRCPMVDNDLPAERCPIFKGVKRHVKIPHACPTHTANGAFQNEGYGPGRRE